MQKTGRTPSTALRIEGYWRLAERLKNKEEVQQNIPESPPTKRLRSHDEIVVALRSQVEELQNQVEELQQTARQKRAANVAKANAMRVITLQLVTYFPQQEVKRLEFASTFDELSRNFKEICEEHSEMLDYLYMHISTKNP
jgi:hypothetical protein